MDEPPTEAVARNRIQEYLARRVEALPAGQTGAADAGRGDGSLSVTAAAPCFPDTSRGDDALPAQRDEPRQP